MKSDAELDALFQALISGEFSPLKSRTEILVRDFWWRAKMGQPGPKWASGGQKI
jgi:hypothetical protein